MRLLNTKTQEFGEFFNSQIPTYCILSHRWGADEVTYKDVFSKSFNTSSDGYMKLNGSCRLARHYGFDWIWIDTCCINKDSSAELAEAINSMFSFYANAALCIAYLFDVPSVAHISREKDAWSQRTEQFCDSDWWNRGWTLQELLAPQHLDFFDHDFQLIGSKTELSRVVSSRTGIAPKYLTGRKPFNYASVATRMSWASRRTTTRPEDQAYCLLGIFGVTMPLLYGDGKMAFYRLQREILANTNDESIFAWIAKDATEDELFGLLAESPRDFLHSQNVVPIELPPDKRPPVSLTSRGLEFWHGLKKSDSAETEDSKQYIKGEGFVALACKRRSSRKEHGERRTVSICLREVNGAWYRVKCDRFFHTFEELESDYFQKFYVAQPNLTTAPRFSGNRRDVGASVQRRREEEEEKSAKEQMAVIKFIGAAVLVVGAGVALTHGFQNHGFGLSKKRHRSRSASRSRSRSGSRGRSREQRQR